MFPSLPYLLAGRYRLTRQLGSGNFAEAYLATDTLSGRQVAVKVLREHYASDPHYAARFERESRSAAAVEHPNIVAVFDTGREDNTLFIVMEYIEGCDLKQFIRQQAPLSVSEAIPLMRQLLDGLAAIHHAGVVHRDVKPQNVLLTGDSTVKLSDFGIARGTTDTGLTETGVAIGTAAYMAPEQASGADSGPEADLYAAGVILFELVTGHLPFPGDNPVQVMYQQVHESPPMPRDITPNVPVELEQVILRALEKDPDHRFTSAEEMASALDAVSPAIEASDEVTTPLMAVQPEQTPGQLAGNAVLAGIASDRHRRLPGRMRRPRRAGKRANYSNWTLPLVAGLLLLIGIVAIVAMAGRDGVDEDLALAVDPSPTASTETGEPAAAPNNPNEENEEQEFTGTSSDDTQPEMNNSEKEREKAEKEAEKERKKAGEEAEKQREKAEKDDDDEDDDD